LDLLNIVKEFMNKVLNDDFIKTVNKLIKFSEDVDIGIVSSYMKFRA